MNRGKVLAIDYGKKSVGLATGDLEVKVAFPNDVIVNRGMSDLVEKVLKVCEEYEVVLVVLGVPGSENAIVGEIEDFGRLLEVRGLKVEYVNEDYSSMEAEQMFDGVPHEGRFDDSAAQVILTRYFNSL